jgi:hypothetical protein
VNLIRPGKNLIINGDFSNDLYAWNWEVDHQASAEVQLIDRVCNFVIQNGGQDYKDIQLKQDSILLIHGQNYLFEFDARADEPRVVEIKIVEGDSPFTNYSRIDKVALTSTLKRFTYIFEMKESTDNNARVVINAGGSDINIFIDNLSLKMVVL